jgi:hypothetical protein
VKKEKNKTPPYFLEVAFKFSKAAFRDAKVAFQCHETPL